MADDGDDADDDEDDDDADDALALDCPASPGVWP
jgi:hypothetical protein